MSFKEITREEYKDASAICHAHWEASRIRERIHSVQRDFIAHLEKFSEMSEQNFFEEKQRYTEELHQLQEELDAIEIPHEVSYQQACRIVDNYFEQLEQKIHEEVLDRYYLEKIDALLRRYGVSNDPEVHERYRYVISTPRGILYFENWEDAKRVHHEIPRLISAVFTVVEFLEKTIREMKLP